MNITTNVNPRKMFIDFMECDVCNSKNLYNNKIIYIYDKVPKKSITCCNLKYCFLSSIKKYLIDLKKNDIYPFCEFSKLFLENNLLSDKFYYKSTIKIYNKKYLIKYYDFNLFCERYLVLNNIKDIKDYNLFNWFLNREKIQ